MTNSLDDMYDSESPIPDITVPNAPATTSRAQSSSSLRYTPSERQASQAAPNQPQPLKYITGKCHPCNETGKVIHDPSHHRVFMYGGYRKRDSTNQGTADFGCLDTRSMKWTDLSYMLTYEPNFPYKSEETEVGKPLPRLRHPGAALVQLGDACFIYLFGGFDCQKNAVANDFVVINIELLTWHYLKLDHAGQAAGPRIDPSMVFARNKLYIFGGYRRFTPSDDCKPYHSFSVLRYNATQKVWNWEIQDRSYPCSIPDGHVIGQAVSVYGGQKILLTPGNLAIDTPINFDQENIFFYHTTNDTFQPATIGFHGELPRDVFWYTTHPYSEYQRNTNSSRSPSFEPLPEIIILTAWVPFSKVAQDLEDIDIIPDIWRIVLTPKDSIECLGIKNKIWDINHEFMTALLVDDNVRVMGTLPVDFIGDEIDDDEFNDKNPTWNIYVDISLHDGHLQL